MNRWDQYIAVRKGVVEARVEYPGAWVSSLAMPNYLKSCSRHGSLRSSVVIPGVLSDGTPPTSIAGDWPSGLPLFCH